MLRFIKNIGIGMKNHEFHMSDVDKQHYEDVGYTEFMKYSDKLECNTVALIVGVATVGMGVHSAIGADGIWHQGILGKSIVGGLVGLGVGYIVSPIGLLADKVRYGIKEAYRVEKQMKKNHGHEKHHVYGKWELEMNSSDGMTFAANKLRQCKICNNFEIVKLGKGGVGSYEHANFGSGASLVKKKMGFHDKMKVRENYVTCGFKNGIYYNKENIRRPKPYIACKG